MGGFFSKEDERCQVTGLAVEPDEEKTFEVFLLGDNGVGKQSILRIATGKDIDDENIMSDTCELKIDSYSHPITIKFFRMFNFQISQPYLYRYIKNADAFIFIYDCSNRESFDNIDKYNSEQIHPDCPKYLVGNKRDLLPYDDCDIKDYVSEAEGKKKLTN